MVNKKEIEESHRKYNVSLDFSAQRPSLTENEKVKSPEIQIRKWMTDYNICCAETLDFDKDLEVEKKERKDQRKHKSSCIDVYIIMKCFIILGFKILIFGIQKSYQGEQINILYFP